MPVIAVDTFWTRLDSGKIYKITRVVDDEDGSRICHYVRHDGVGYALNSQRFLIDFRRATSQEQAEYYRLALGMPTTPTATASPTPNPQPVELPEIGQYWTHLESNGVYKVTEVVEGMVKYRRNDNREFELTSTRFLQRLRRATPEEAASYNQTVEDGDRDTSAEVGTLIHPNAAIYNWDRVILNRAIIMDIRASVRSILNRDALVRRFRLTDLDENTNRSVMNFHGDPGTGKTLAAKCISAELNLPLYQVDYASIISKYLGDTAKHIKLAFRKATQHNAILFFDEGDSLLSRRQDSGDNMTSLNQNRNVLMQELDRFNGIVIISTNLFTHYDPAIVRRINRHIKFILPNTAERTALYQLHVRTPEYTEGVDYERLGALSEGLSGGDIKVVVLNAIERACSSENEADWIITQQELEECTETTKAAKAANAVGNSR